MHPHSKQHLSFPLRAQSVLAVATRQRNPFSVPPQALAHKLSRCCVDPCYRLLAPDLLFFCNLKHLFPQFSRFVALFTGFFLPLFLHTHAAYLYLEGRQHWALRVLIASDKYTSAHKFIQSRLGLTYPRQFPDCPNSRSVLTLPLSQTTQRCYFQEFWNPWTLYHAINIKCEKIGLLNPSHQALPLSAALTLRRKLILSGQPLIERGAFRSEHGMWSLYRSARSLYPQLALHVENWPH